MSSYFDRFDRSIDLNMLENPLMPRQSENAAWLLGQRYLLDRYDGQLKAIRQENGFEEFARRISRIIASSETLYRGEGDLDWIRTLEMNLFSDILNRRFLFNSPCLFGAGAGMVSHPELAELIYRSPYDMSFEDYKVVCNSRTDNQQLFACFVIDVPDSIEGIFSSVQDAAIISKYGGGVGANFGNLREFGSNIKGGAGGKATGPVSFMETWNTMGSVVVQGGRRRAALMGMLYDDHPDIEKFIDAKTEDGKLSYFNISVSLSDRLLRATKDGGDFNLLSRVDGSVVKTVKARDLWDKLCKKAWMRGDPGVFFGDRANDDNILKLDSQWKIESTNPCVTGDTWVATSEGAEQVVDLLDKPVTLLVDGESYETSGFFSTGTKKVYRLSLDDGKYLDLTKDHKVMIKSTEGWSWCEAEKLSIGDEVRLHDHSGISNPVSKAKSFEAVGEAPVFDVMVPGINAFDANGLYVHNCGEQPLPNYTSCNLGSINMEAFVSSEASGKPVFDMEGFIDQVYRSIYYLDLVIDSTSYPLPSIGERTKKIRPLGLGLMGLADSAIMLGMTYGSDDFKSHCRDLANAMAGASLLASERIVSEMGKEPFPEHHLVAGLIAKFKDEVDLPGVLQKNWLDKMDESSFRRLLSHMRSSKTVPYTLVNTLEGLLSAPVICEGNRMDTIREVLEGLVSGRMRNSRRLSIAPTGSISMLLDSSAGIEPNFAWGWDRRVMKSDGDGYETREYFHRLLSKDQREEFRHTGTISDDHYVTAYDIGTEAHVAVTGIFASVVDSGISKTVNLPSEATVEDVKKVYEDCYRLGCKGITIYRDGSRSEQPIEAKSAEPEAPAKRPHTSRVKDRPGNVVFGKTVKDNTPWGSLYVTLNYDGDEPFEVFASLGKSGSEMKSMTEALSRVISIGLRSGGKLEDFVATLRGLSGKEYWTFNCDDETVVRSIPDGVAVLLEKLIGNSEEEHHSNNPVCPECGAPMELVAGCEYCFSCGYSPCK